MRFTKPHHALIEILNIAWAGVVMGVWGFCISFPKLISCFRHPLLLNY